MQKWNRVLRNSRKWS